MPTLVILSNSAEWRSPLRALLRERSIDAIELDDALDAIGALRTAGGGLLVIHGEMGADDVSMAISSALKRFATGLTIVVAGATTASLPAAVLVHREEARFLALCELIVANLPSEFRSTTTAPANPAPPATPAPRFETTTRFEAPSRYELDASGYANGAETALPRLNSAHIQRLLHTARHGSYYTLLGITPQHSTQAAREAAINLLSQLSEEGVAPSVLDNFGDILRELRAAVADARDVLSTPSLRARYQPIA